MKLSEFILEATGNDMSVGAADVILKKAKEGGRRTISAKGRLILALAAVLFLLTLSVSAAVWLSGFGTAFDTPLESGTVAILSQSSTNDDVVWSITEVWFDEYNLHIGGTVTTPEPLEVGQEYRFSGIFCERGEDERYYLDGEAYPNGDVTVPFAMSARTISDGEGNFWRKEFDSDEIVIELRLRGFIRYPDDFEGSFKAEDYLAYPGEWNFTVKFANAGSSDEVRLTAPFTDGTVAEGISVDGVVLNPFTLVITGDGLAHPDDGVNYMIWLKMKDGTYMFKKRGVFASDSSNWIAYRDKSDPDRKIAVCFWDPIDVSQVESVIIADLWGTGSKPLDDKAESYPVEDGRFESWKSIIEIPLR